MFHTKNIAHLIAALEQLLKEGKTGETMANKPYTLTVQQRLDIVRMYEEGHKLEYIAALFGVRREYVSKLALRRGVSYRCPNMRKRNIVKV